MPLELSPITDEAGIRDFVRIHKAAFIEGISAVLTFPSTTPPDPAAPDAIFDRAWKQFTTDPKVRFLKVTDTETGEVISASKWFDYSGGMSEEEVRETTEGVPPLPENGNKPAWEDMFGYLLEMRAKWLVPRKAWFLAILVTDPKHHRRGAGALHLKWGCEQADKTETEAYLEASPAGRPLYARFGFQPTEERRFDLTKYGGTGEEINTVMIRPAKGASEISKPN